MKYILLDDTILWYYNGLAIFQRHMSKKNIIEEVSGLYQVLPLKILRRTPGVFFDALDPQYFSHIDAIDRVIHTKGAISPGPVGGVERPWYMHPWQDDNLIVLQGTRYIDIYTKEYGRIESFEVKPNLVKNGNRIVFDGPAMLVWPKGVFHRIRSCDKEGSASLNFAVHYSGFDIKTNFSIYDLNTETGDYHVIREGIKDQPKQ